MSPSRTCRFSQSTSTGMVQDTISSCFPIAGSSASAEMLARKPRGEPVGVDEVTAVTADGPTSTTWLICSGVSLTSQLATSGSARERG